MAERRCHATVVVMIGRSAFNRRLARQLAYLTRRLDSSDHCETGQKGHFNLHMTDDMSSAEGLQPQIQFACSTFNDARGAIKRLFKGIMTKIHDQNSVTEGPRLAQLNRQMQNVSKERDQARQERDGANERCDQAQQERDDAIRQRDELLQELRRLRTSGAPEASQENQGMETEG